MRCAHFDPLVFVMFGILTTVILHAALVVRAMAPIVEACAMPTLAPALRGSHGPTSQVQARHRSLEQEQR